VNVLNDEYDLELAVDDLRPSHSKKFFEMLKMKYRSRKKRIEAKARIGETVASQMTLEDLPRQAVESRASASIGLLGFIWSPQLAFAVDASTRVTLFYT